MKGELFADYVRMIRARKGVDWSEYLTPEDLGYLRQIIEPNGWYPMETFERLGNAILAEIAMGNLEAVKMWGRLSADQLKLLHPNLVAPGDPIETLSRFRVLRATFFDFEALEVLQLHEHEAQLAIAYHMGMPAEEAASLQTMGFFERLLELAGANQVRASFRQRSWAGGTRTIVVLTWG